MNTATYNKDFHRTVKKAEIPTCNILGVDIAAIDMEWLLAYLNNNIKALAGDYICVSNVHTTVQELKMLKMLQTVLNGYTEEKKYIHILNDWA